MAHRIQNFEKLATSSLREDALAIAEAGYGAIDIGDALARTLQIEGDTLRVRGKDYRLAGRNIYFVGIGKCAFAAAAGIEKLFGERLAGGIAFDVSAVVPGAFAKIEAHTGTHPLPSEVNEVATTRIMEFLSGRTEDDLVIMLISGGGSTLLCLHDAPMTCADESVLFGELTARGATIQEINTVRKHISRARGGGLVFAAYPAEVISLIVSDVPGNDIEYIASGATVLDTSTIADAQAVLARYGITAPNVGFIETPKDPTHFERVNNILFLTNADALAAMQAEAVKRGYAATIADDRFTGEARDVGRAIAARLHEAPAKSALLYAGESTVTIAAHSERGGLAASKPQGGGGRNQEMALAALGELRDGELILPFSSDGHDNTDHAGAIADSATAAQARAQSLSIGEYLEAHRSYDFFTTVGDALITGYTGTNVSDLIIALKNNVNYHE